MSASNWAICPRCRDRAKVAHVADCARVQALYGQIASAEWRALLDALEEFNEEPFRTFREDYEIYGAEQGSIVTDYSGHCQTCGLGLDFKREHPFYSSEE